jgi:hypothetical protein
MAMVTLHLGLKTRFAPRSDCRALLGRTEACFKSANVVYSYRWQEKLNKACTSWIHQMAGFLQLFSPFKSADLFG